MAEWITGAISRLLASIRTYAGALSLAGALTAVYTAVYSVTKSGAVTIAGGISHMLQMLRTYTASITPAGSISRALQSIRAYTGGITPAGARTRLVNTTRRTLRGFIDFKGTRYIGNFLRGAVSRTFNLFRTIGGTLTTAGEVLAVHGATHTKTVSSALTLAGAHAWDLFAAPGVRASILALQATISRAHSFFRTYAAVLTFTGISTRTNSILGRTYGGTVSFAGNIWKMVTNIQAGVLSFAGDVTASGIFKIRTYTGALSFAGTAIVSKIMGRLQSAALTFSGVVTRSAAGKYWPTARAGILTINGALIAAFGIAKGPYSGTLEVFGRITRIDAILDRLSAATITPAGARLRGLITTRSIRAGALSFLGVSSRWISVPEIKAGVLSFAGDTSKAAITAWHYTATGALSFTGAVTRLHVFLRTYAGGITPAGAYSRAIEAARTRTGEITFSSMLDHLFFSADWRAGVLTPAGVFVRSLITMRTPIPATLTMTGSHTHDHPTLVYRTKAGRLSFTAEARKRIKEVLYLGPPNP